MKKLFTIYLLIACSITLTGFSQTLSGEYSNDGSSTPSYYTKIKWEVSYTFIEKNGLFYIKFYNPKIKVPNYALYHDEFGKEYSLADLNLEIWPTARQLPFAMGVKVNISDGFNNYESTANCNSNFTCDENYIADKANLKNVGIGNFRVTSVSYFHANLGGEPGVDAILKNKRQSGNKSTVTSSNTTTSSSTSTENTNSNSINETTVYTPTYTKQDVTNQVITQAATLAGGLINEMNANYDKKMARWQAESDANTAAIRAANKKKTEVKFRAEFLPLMKQAVNGDDDARMALYFAVGELDCYDYVSYKQREEWLKQALAHNNLNAILENSISLGYHGPESISALEKAADLGSLDAMMILASWYNMKTYKTYGVTFIGGDNPQKAIEWFTKGALSGCPVSMYHLGMIYKYGKTMTVRGHLKKGMVIYGKEIINEKLAFEWFSKSIQYPTYKKSLFARSLQTHYWFLSEFDPRAYDELAKMYTEGKVLPKDQAKSIAIKTEASKWSELKENEDIREMKRYN